MTQPAVLPPAPPLSSILEAALYVNDLTAAAHFYGTLLGLPEVVRVENRHIFYRVGPSILLLFNPQATQIPTTNPRLPVPPHGATGPGHVCFAATGEEIEQWVQRLKSSAVAIEADFEWPNGARSIYFRDPAGNSLEMAEPRLWG